MTHAELKVALQLAWSHGYEVGREHGRKASSQEQERVRELKEAEAAKVEGLVRSYFVKPATPGGSHE